MQTFRTGQIAKICEVAPRTVVKWIDTGLLTGYRIPGGGRRVERAVLEKFIQDHGMPFVLPAKEKV